MAESQAVIDSGVEDYLPQITKLLDNNLEGVRAKVYLYGSRARGDQHVASDIDLAIVTRDATSLDSILPRVREAFFESHIPYKVDFVNLDTVPQKLRDQIKKEGVLIWER